MKLDEALHIDLGEIDHTLRTIVESDPSLSHDSDIRKHVLRLIAAGGKRLRPMMVIVGSRFGKPGPHYKNSVLRAAALLEYVHTASLIHDDIIDQSELRRGVPTLHAATDVRSAVFTANYMMARAIEWASADASDEDQSEMAATRIPALASIVTELCLGEYGQLRDRFNFKLSIEAYMDKTRRKTALLMAHCLRAGAEATYANPYIGDKLFAFGEALGMAFQIRDDVLDFAESNLAIGKPTGADLRNGIITLPVLYAMEDPNLASKLLLLSQQSSESDMDEVIQLIKESGAVDRASSIADTFTLQARELAVCLRDYPASQDLLRLTDYFTA
ncbi:polyprenyl synthetase [Paenibacillus agaridevorans]|uniref:Polyprenyl synthetase n=1 Tax=Paenibacillus agaridevorans TaxID=171404 RepID=A0A2R5EU48_9BACL|nr:polyprenyl synthetase family protein [Paenibacillus agaridevorans]GBG10067.1 polyprenyl synthetase [Paenibacillus agaridevorans]